MTEPQDRFGVAIRALTLGAMASTPAGRSSKAIGISTGPDPEASPSTIRRPRLWRRDKILGATLGATQSA
jgi:hypothetical protein